MTTITPETVHSAERGDIYGPVATPAQIVEANGHVHTGWFAQPFENANLGDAPASHVFAPLRETALGFLEQRLRRLRLKQWHYTSVVTDEVMFACAIVDAGYLGKVFAYLVDRVRGQIYEWDRTLPMARGVTIAENSLNGTTEYSGRGFGSIVLSNDASTGTRRVVAELRAKRGAPALFADFLIWDDGQNPAPAVIVEQLGAGRWVYTHKVYGLETEGRLRCGDLNLDIPRGGALAGIDWNRGYRLTTTYWNWAAGAGYDTAKRRIGFNLTSHYDPQNRAGQNADVQSGHDAQDCVFWVGNERVKLERVHFEYDRDDLLRPWRIRHDGGLLDLTFHPDGERHEDIDLKLMVSQFHQPYGRFTGSLRTPGGVVADLTDAYGVTEQHFARW